ncbi:AmpG family muropeptide MFS transporter [Lysobacter yangpyeongensis]|uniref:AmpG family muropeptide MFS transporter n=1 Tax=Lysobacter yangpyeongensis TaxID=346182 RepID=A0ABW0SQL7_9GAMM
MTTPSDAARKSGFFASLADYWRPGVREMLFLGFAAGLPFPMVLTTLSARLRLAGIDRTTIGLFSLVGLAYSLKFVWAPIVDRYRLPGFGALGQRRAWMLLAQVGVITGLVALALADPASDAQRVALLAAITAFCSATQDITIDAYRIEASDASLQGSASAAYQIGYQVALICSGALALTTASHGGWTAAYFLIATLMLVGIVATMRIREPVAAIERGRPQPALIEATAARLRPTMVLGALATTVVAWWGLRMLLPAKDSTLALDATAVAIACFELALFAVLQLHALRGVRERLIGSVALPLLDIVDRFGWKLVVPMLLLIVTYRLNYMTMGVAANTFYLDMGYTLDEVAVVSKLYGIALTLFGAVYAGWLVKRLGFMRSLLLGLVLLSAANLLYGHVATLPKDPSPGIAWLAAAISLDNVANGIAGTAFIAYMSSLTSKQYTATQYALFGTLWSLPAKSLASQWGRIVDAWGYPPFFVYTAAMGLPALILVLWLMRRERLAAARSAGEQV